MRTSLPILLLLSSAAVGAAGLGAAVGARRGGLSAAALGWAGASAAGLMLGVAYALVAPGVAQAPWAAALGAALACVALWLPQARTPDVPRDARAAVRASALHSAAEGVAVGAALALGARFGLVLALTLVVHNLSEGAVLGAALRDEGHGRAAAARAATLARGGQVLFALLTGALVAAQPAALPWALGAGFGALVYLLFAELLPDSYVAVGRTGIALVVSIGLGIVALLGGGARGGAP